MGTGEALLNVRTRGGQTRGGQSGQAGAKGASATDSEEFDFQGGLQKFDKVKEGWISVAFAVGFVRMIGGGSRVFGVVCCAVMSRGSVVT